MTKKEELLTFLNKKLFNPILQSPYASNELKHDFQHMSSTISTFSVEGILIYFWTTMTNVEAQMIFSNCLEDDDLLDFSSFLQEFKGYFTYEWLRS